MKKDTKVYEIKAIAANGNDRTVHAAVSLDATLADVCKLRNIPMLSIISTSVTAPMTFIDACRYAMHRTAAVIFNPNVVYAKTHIDVCVA